MNDAAGDVVGWNEGRPCAQRSHIADAAGPRGARRLLAEVELVGPNDLRPVNGISKATDTVYK